MKELPFQELDPIPPQLAEDPKNANIVALKDHDPRMGVYATGIDIDSGKPMIAYLVDGSWIRSNVWQDWTSGGNNGRYPWIPDEEIWLDVANVNEYDLNLIHETVEDLEMRDIHLQYVPAHSKFANSEEFTARHNPEKIVQMLRMLGWRV